MSDTATHDLPWSEIQKANPEASPEVLREGDTLRAQYLRKKDELLPKDNASDNMERFRQALAGDDEAQKAKMTEVTELAQEIAKHKDSLFENPNDQVSYDTLQPLIEKFATLMQA